MQLEFANGMLNLKYLILTNKMRLSLLFMSLPNWKKVIHNEFDVI